MWKREIAHGPSLTRFPIFRNELPFKPIRFGRRDKSQLPAAQQRSGPGRTIHARCQFAQNHAEKSRRRRALRRRLQEGLAVGLVRRDWMEIEAEAARHRASQ